MKKELWISIVIYNNIGMGEQYFSHTQNDKYRI
jgi:hypothetical protein